MQIDLDKINLALIWSSISKDREVIIKCNNDMYNKDKITIYVCKIKRHENKYRVLSTFIEDTPISSIDDIDKILEDKEREEYLKLFNELKKEFGG